MKFTIFRVENGYLLNVYYGKHSKSFIYTERERMTMFAKIQDMLGDEPDDSIGMGEEIWPAE